MRIEDSFGDFEHACQREAFLARLEKYVVRRPRTYSDRKWLEGYCEVVRNLIPFLTRNELTHYATGSRAMVERADGVIDKFLTRRVEGQIDAWLDAIGC